MTALPVVPTPRVPVTTTYHGVAVTEEYRWLEDASSEETIRWTEAQQARTRAYLDAIGWRPALRARVEQLMRDDSTTYLSLSSGGELFFALKEQRPRQRPMLVSLTDLDEPGTERVVLDPLEVDPSGETTIDWFVPSPDGSRVAVSLSEHGNEDGTLHVYDVATGEHVGAPIPHVNVMGGSMTWRHDSDGIWYTLPADVGFRQQVWFRDLETGTDTVELTGPFADAQIAENFLSSSPDGRWVMDRVQKGDGGEWQIFVRAQDAGSAWWQVADIPDRCVYAVLGEDAVYLLSRLGTPARPGAAAGVDAGCDRVRRRDDRAGGRPRHRRPRRDHRHGVGGRPGRWSAAGARASTTTAETLAPVEIPPVSSVSSFVARLTRLRPDLVAWRGASFTDPAPGGCTGDGGAPGADRPADHDLGRSLRDTW